ncbi:MAG: DNA-binding HxlR family transcriptional regulator [Arenicella sp.]|jgi:DNA-binding HxlR family transcriptional regulator
MEKHFRSSCIIASALDLIGDKWSLVIIRDMLLYHKKTYKELAACDEGIATNLLSTRLKLLEDIEIITKRKIEGNKKENIYLLTDKAIELAPLIMEIVIWSDRYVRDYNPQMNPHDRNFDKKILIEGTQDKYSSFRDQILA